MRYTKDQCGTDRRRRSGRGNCREVSAALDRSEPAIGLCNEIEARFSTSDCAEVREQVAKALFQKSTFLAQIGRGGEANKVFEELVERFSGAPEQPIRDWLGPLLASRAEAQKKQERTAYLDALIERFAETGDPSLRAQVTEALNEKALRLTWVLGSRFWMNCWGTFPKHQKPKSVAGCVAGVPAIVLRTTDQRY